MTNPLFKATDRILTFGAVIGALCVWLIAGAVFYDVTMRYLGWPTIWALEISTYLMIGAAVLASGKAVIDRDHFSVDLLPQALSRRPRRLLALASTTACVLLIAFVTYGFSELMLLSIQLDMKSATMLRIPLWIPQSVMVLGFVLMLLAFVRDFFRTGEREQ
jgi:C4-dicarboxylate transporter DctQ subunit